MVMLSGEQERNWPVSRAGTGGFPPLAVLPSQSGSTLPTSPHDPAASKYSDPPASLATNPRHQPNMRHLDRGDRGLVSAVSSLSESKLNALGLCLSIAINVKSPSPFDFLVIDDPIQSLDHEHETKFIDVIRDLVSHKKQIVLLSHNPVWLKQVRASCADLNGRAYEITGYTEAGPHIREIHWAENDQRLSTILGILNDQTADSVRLQHVEEEVRIVANQLAVDLLFKKTAQKKSAHSLNAEETKKILLSSGIEPAFANKIMSAFETVDPAHHAEKGYAPVRERIRTYYSWLKELQQIVNKS
jgi:hypothetical protein